MMYQLNEPFVFFSEVEVILFRAKDGIGSVQLKYFSVYCDLFCVFF